MVGGKTTYHGIFLVGVGKRPIQKILWVTPGGDRKTTRFDLLPAHFSLFAFVMLCYEIFCQN